MSAIYRTEAGRLAVEASYREALAAWPEPRETSCIQTRHGDTFVIASGTIDAPPLVLFQGSGANSALWTTDIAELSAAFRVYAVDVIGEPGLSAANRPPLDGDAHACWIDDVMRGLGVVSASFVGVSLGGWLALDYAIRRPMAVKSAVVMCPSGVGRQRVSFMLKVLPLLLLGARGRRRVMQMLGGRATPAPLLPHVLKMLAVIRQHFRPRRGKVPRFSDEQLARLTMPVLAILGGRDVMLDSGETKQRLERFAPRAHVRYLEDAGHLLPKQTTEIIEFLGGTGVRSAATS